MKILLDNGHGIETIGKRSPDESLLEYAWTRKFANDLAEDLNGLNMFSDIILITPEESDIALSERCARVNKIVNDADSEECLLISIHVNAAGSDGQWHSANGWQVIVSKNASEKSKSFASLCVGQSEKLELVTRKYSASVPYWTQNLAICRDTNCPAVVTENMFMDNKTDVEFLLSEDGQKILRQLHIGAILSYYTSL